MSDRITLTIVIPTFNRILSLKRTIESMTPMMSCESIDIYVVDNASNDGTWEWLVEYSKDSNLKIIQNPYNYGIEGNIIRALTITPNGYIWIVSDHMIINHEAVFDALDKLKEGPPISLAYACIEQYGSVLDPFIHNKFGELSGEKRGELLSHMGNISGFLVNTDYMKRCIRFIYRFSGYSYPHTGAFVVAEADDIVVEFPNMSKFDDKRSSSWRISYDAFRSRFISLVKARDEVLRLNNFFINKSIMNKSLRQWSPALAFESMLAVCFGDKNSPGFSEYLFCFRRYSGKVRIVLFACILVSLLPLKSAILRRLPKAPHKFDMYCS